ncbi:N-myc protein [Tribolium castaneum]|uniref:BHLH domain-containing protein n=1 Tax=Tribolium castaneum TaxID=7070 RepID=A0A139WLS9_TRICA|nr:PREDICTED: N-myc protein [Tribolium castaneum]XP_008199546.1 PREDICTED: N-myc protein [Tribolium castaneum]XP_008199547.1 PREDICTED: N-myc protein [Tribolium castaneum]XP_008199548.1 PREDICTED: N-myc protein [Tribolium castaneum]KYB28785.1 hypothetical protein TcasGA2_TC032473 [Tribolium castaneum]|eukprot:XP_008199545.1 PREDICTED: N-myc protein [Tribolium castaneum]
MDEFKIEFDATLTDDYLLSDDIWKQFQIEELQPFSSSFDCSTTCSFLCDEKNCQVKYDCMWNGHCKGAHGNRSCNSKTTPGDVKPPVVQVPQQSLLKPDLKISVDPNTVVPMMPSLHYSIQTPPISDDEDTKPTQILQSLQSALSENELDDADLSDYFKDDDAWGFFDDGLDEEEEEEEEEEDEIDEERRKHENDMRAFYAATDHSYHKGTAPVHSGSLGIDTPSDSEEEEIDVVSLEKKPPGGALPTNPSTKDRRQIQRTMQSRFPQGLKTIMPVRQPPKKAPRRVKQSRQYKRRLNYSSDSEPEPSEKRHLHNNMERQRRIDLRNLFNDLKKLIPDISKKQRAAKVLILRGAAQYCRDLQSTHEALARRTEALKQQQARYRAHLAKLRRDCAAKR